MFWLCVVGIILIITLAIAVPIYAWSIGFPQHTYDIRKAKAWLRNAQETTDLGLVIEYVTNAKEEIKDYKGNPAWWYPTADTDFEVIKSNMDGIINKCKELQNEDPNSFAYQQQVHNLGEYTIPRLRNSLTQTIDFLTWKSFGSTYWFVVFLLLFSACAIGLFLF